MGGRTGGGGQEVVFEKNANHKLIILDLLVALILIMP
jgi:hypothetical protein